MRKRFVKLLLFKVDTQYRLLYGFSSETEQSSYLWKAFPADKKGQKLIVKAILSPSEADNFSINLTGTEPIMLCERVTLKSPQLYKREQLLYSDDEEQQTVPISEFCYLSEFWNREKHSLLSEIQNEFSADGRTRYEQTLELLEWAKCNCGIDFCMDGRRFGNYEVYYRTPENSSFEIDIHKDQGLRVTTIRKRKDFAEDIIVNCIGKYKDYVICNQTQVWPANKKEIYFEANEPMTSVVVHAWNAATGKLIVSQSIALMMGLSIISRWGGTPYQIGDSWTNKLLHSAAKSSELIRTQLMKVHRITTDRVQNFSFPILNDFDSRRRQSYSRDYCSCFSTCNGVRWSECSGSFISGQDACSVKSKYLISVFASFAYVRNIIIVNVVDNGKIRCCFRENMCYLRSCCVSIEAGIFVARDNSIFYTIVQIAIIPFTII